MKQPDSQLCRFVVNPGKNVLGVQEDFVPLTFTAQWEPQASAEDCFAGFRVWGEEKPVALTREAATRVLYLRVLVVEATVAVAGLKPLIYLGSASYNGRTYHAFYDDRLFDTRANAELWDAEVVLWPPTGASA